MEWNFLLNKVLLTQLPAPWARAELSGGGGPSTLLKYRLIGIAALAQADPVTSGFSGLLWAPQGSSGHDAWKLAVHLS